MLGHPFAKTNQHLVYFFQLCVCMHVLCVLELLNHANGSTSYMLSSYISTLCFCSWTIYMSEIYAKFCRKIDMVRHKAQYSVFALARANNYLDRIKFQKFIKKLQSVDDNQN